MNKLRQPKFKKCIQTINKENEISISYLNDTKITLARMTKLFL